MHKASLVILILLSISCSLSARTLRELAFMHIEFLPSRGMTQVGDINIPELLENSRDIDVVSFKFGFPIGSGGVRDGIVYNIEENYIAFYPPLWNRLPLIQRKTLGLHEFLGAMGYNDEHYEISLPLFLLGLSRRPQKYLEENKELFGAFYNTQQSKENRIYVASNVNYYGLKGVTGVEGGGDGPSIGLKLNLLEMNNIIYFININYDRKHLSDMIKAILKTQIESKEGSINGISYTTNEKKYVLKHNVPIDYKVTKEGKLLVVIPRNYWNNTVLKNSKLEMALMEEIYIKIYEHFGDPSWKK